VQYSKEEFISELDGQRKLASFSQIVLKKQLKSQTLSSQRRPF